MPRGGRRPGAGAKPGAKRRALLTPRQLTPHKVVRGAFGLPEPPVASPAAAPPVMNNEALNLGSAAAGPILKRVIPIAVGVVVVVGAEQRGDVLSGFAARGAHGALIVALT